MLAIKRFSTRRLFAAIALCAFVLLAGLTQPARADSGDEVKRLPATTTQANGSGGASSPQTMGKITVTGGLTVNGFGWEHFDSLGAFEHATYVSVVGSGNSGIRAIYSPPNRKASSTTANNKGGCEGSDSDPIVVAHGAKVFELPVFATSGEMGLRYALYYHSKHNASPWDDNPLGIQHFLCAGPVLRGR